MKNLIVILLLLVGAIWLMGCNKPNTPPIKPREKSWTEIVQSVKQSVVTVIVRDEMGRVIQCCSGFFVPPPEPNAYARVATCAHCVNVFGAASAEVILSTGAKYPVRYIVAEDAEHDLVKLSVELPGNAVPSLPLAKTLPYQGDRVFVIGSPNCFPGSLSTGIVSNVIEWPEGELDTVLMTDCVTDKGSSGGPMINMMTGEVVGVISFHVERLNFAMPSTLVWVLPAIRPQKLADWSRAKQADYIKEFERFRELIENMLDLPPLPEPPPTLEQPPTPEPPQPPKPPRPEQIPDPALRPTPPESPKPFDLPPIPKLPPTPKPLEQLLDPEWQLTSPGDVLRQEAGERIRRARKGN